MNSSTPNTRAVTVLMPTYNSARYLAEAIESILQQTMNDLELVILDGGSTDCTLDIARAYASRDSRMSIEISPGTHPTRRADDYMPRIRSKFIALQHSDDVSYPNRLAAQVQAFEQSPGLGVCSALYRQFWHICTEPSKPGKVLRQKPAGHEEIKAQLLFWWVMHCPTLMLDREKALRAGLRFSNDFKYGNDYWVTVSNIDKLQYANIQQELSAYRIHPESDGMSNTEGLRQEERALKEKVLRHFGFTFTAQEFEAHQSIQLFPDNRLNATTANDYDAILLWLKNLRSQNDAKGIFDRKIFSDLLDHIAEKTSLFKRRHLIRSFRQRVKKWVGLK